MADIKLDNKLFQERISHFTTAWKNDLRSKESLFGGASSLVIMMGKVEDAPELHKNNAIHVSAFLRYGLSRRWQVRDG
jgi:nucleosome binding factor SPN SPT16 subunit